LQVQNKYIPRRSKQQQM